MNKYNRKKGGEIHQARKRFGQNFLIDEGIIAALVAAVHLRLGDHLIEIGPGLGALTKPLLKAAQTMTAIELDRDLIAHLSSFNGLTLIHADVLTLDIAALKSKEHKIRFVGNLPYNISTPIIFHLLAHCAAIEDMHFMLQKEVVERIGAQPGSRDYGRLSVMVQRYCLVEPLMLIPPQSFNPAPKVMSQFMRLTPHVTAPAQINDDACFAKIVKASFAMKRKTLKNNLAEWLTPQQIGDCGIDPSVRAEMLSIADFAALANTHHKQIQG